MSNPLRWLIVRQRPADHPELDALVGELQAGFGLDPYTTRQRLLGPGLAQLARDEEASLDGLATTLRRHGYRCWLVAPPRPLFVPPRMRGLAIGTATVDFLCEDERRVRLERGMAVVGVLADISGELAGRQVKRMLARNAYLGRDQAIVFTPQEIRQAILKGQPVFDCYLLDDQAAVASAFRVFPGRFNPEGLGGRASLGAARNLEAVLELVGEYAGSYRLYCDFGLSQLPGCLPQPANNDPSVVLGNLDALTRYGWLMTGLIEPVTPEEVVVADSPEKMLAAGLGGVAVAAGLDPIPEELGGVAAAVDRRVDERPEPRRDQALATPLPAPPDRPEKKFSLLRALPVMGTFAAGALLAGIGSVDRLRPVFGQALRSGLLLAVLAAAFCWGAFACLRLKRRIEDTPTSRLRSLAMGLVEVCGRATRRYALVAPMSQSACVWYRLCKYRRDSSNRWTLTSESDSAHVPFALDDGSGQVLVDPAGARVKGTTKLTGYPGESALIGAAVDGGPDEKWVEELIYEGTTLYVLGYARPARGVEPGLHSRTVEVLRRLKLDPSGLHRYDSNGDGRLDADEWRAVRDEAERLAAAGQLAETARSADHVLLGKPPRGLPFLIAEGQNETELAGKYGWFGAVLLVLGLLAAGVALKLFLEFYRLV